MNWLDVLLVLLFAAGLAGGYFQGFLRQAMSLGAIACALILATYLQVLLGGWLAFTFPGTSTSTRQTVAFILLVAVITGILEGVQRRAFPETRVLAIGVFDGIAGVPIALLAACLQIGFFAVILRFLVGLSWPIGETLRLFLLRGTESSTLLAGLYNLLVYLVTIVGGLLPRGMMPGFLKPI